MPLNWKRTTVLAAIAFCASAQLAAQSSDAVMAKINVTKAFLLKQRALPDYRASIRKSILNYESRLDAHCKEINLDFDSVDVRDRILGLVEMDEKGVPVAGSWKESIPGTACNEKRRFNIQVDVTRQGLRYTATFPGDAAGNPELQNDTVKNIETNLRMLGMLSQKSCHIEVIDTHLVGAASSVMSDGTMTPWKETWTIGACGKVYSVPVTYRPDNRGTAISVATSEIQVQ